MSWGIINYFSVLLQWKTLSQARIIMLNQKMVEAIEILLHHSDSNIGNGSWRILNEQHYF